MIKCKTHRWSDTFGPVQSCHIQQTLTDSDSDSYFNIGCFGIPRDTWGYLGNFGDVFGIYEGLQSLSRTSFQMLSVILSLSFQKGINKWSQRC